MTRPMAPHQTTQATAETTRLRFNELHKYFMLLGKFETDVEHRFGRYKQQARSHYHVSIGQPYKSKNKLHLQSTLPQSGTSPASQTDEDQSCEEFRKGANIPRTGWNAVVAPQALSRIKYIILVRAHLAGYAVHIHGSEKAKM